MTTTTCELKWLKGLLRSLGVDHFGPMSLYCDNQAALHIATNPVYHERTKHIEVDCHFIRDKISSGNIMTKYVHTSVQLVDILTKALGMNQFDVLLCKLGILDIHAPT
ncbi:Retrovirus-related Pol polyprotein from transposon RE1 [Vitis vinifera]|uniref:Retrovirus-related Pol polyprotein from transposon RE1 n=1 Tax=Vitis vinifera TaxID=29760 RepID=A0A438EFB5_VITVI|nr:Retrovirus-related Pol polyprotein from transposon RE1 [Vitis vinifera]